MKDDTKYVIERAKFADSYIGRIRTFQNQLLIWGVSLNYVSIIYAYNNFDSNRIISGSLIFLNLIIAIIYHSEHQTKDRIINDHKLLDFTPKTEPKESAFKLLLIFLKEMVSFKVYPVMILLFLVILCYWGFTFYKTF